MSPHQSSSCTSFYIVLPSNTHVEGNRTNSFRVHLPRKLHFHSQWCVGLAVLVYPHSWPSLGTTEEQYMRLVWQTGDKLQIPIPSAHLKSPQELAERLRRALEAGSDEMAEKLQALHENYNKIIELAKKEAKETAKQLATASKEKVVLQEPAGPTAEEKIVVVDQEKNAAALYEEIFQQRFDVHLQERFTVAEINLLETVKLHGFKKWIHAYRKPEEFCRFYYANDVQRFKVKMDIQYIESVELSSQLGYILGFGDDQKLLNGTVNTARYLPDMTGGVASFYVYAPDLIEPVMIGDVAAPVLRIVNIKSHQQQDDIVEECYVAIQYHKLITKEISDIFIEIRTQTGSLMPFQYGTCTLTLHFKKIPYF